MTEARAAVTHIGGNSYGAPSYWLESGLWTVLADGAGTAGRHALFENRFRQGAGAAPHLHARHDEMMYVLDGEVTFLLGERQERVREGSLVFIPRGTVHAFRVDSAEARLLDQHSPAGFEAFITTLGQPAPKAALPPPGWKGPEIPPEDRARLFEAIDQTNLDVPNPLKT